MIPSRGLARVEPSGSEIIAFAAAEGALAADGGGSNSPYALALLRYFGDLASMSG